jgi:hypothetical protein
METKWMSFTFAKPIKKVYVSYCYKKHWYSKREFDVIYYIGHLDLFKEFMKEQYIISSIEIMQLNYYTEEL